MLSAIQYCFWVEGSFTFVVFVWGFYYFWSNPEKPVWGGLLAVAGVRAFGALPSSPSNFGTAASGTWWLSIRIGEAAWQWIHWNRFCLLTMSGAAGLLAVEAFAKDPHSIAVAPAALLAAHVGLWDTVFWMRTWEAEVLALY